MNTLDEIKAIIDKCGEEYDCGLFDTEDIYDYDRINIYKKDGVTVNICPDNAYIEVIGLSDLDFDMLLDYYSEKLSDFE